MRVIQLYGLTPEKKNRRTIDRSLRTLSFLSVGCLSLIIFHICIFFFQKTNIHTILLIRINSTNFASENMDDKNHRCETVPNCERATVGLLIAANEIHPPYCLSGWLNCWKTEVGERVGIKCFVHWKSPTSSSLKFVVFIYLKTYNDRYITT